MIEIVCRQTWRKKFVENTKWNSLCGYFVSSLYRETLWLLYVYVRDFCDGITFRGKVHFCIRKRLHYIYFSSKNTHFYLKKQKRIKRLSNIIKIKLRQRVTSVWRHCGLVFTLESMLKNKIWLYL